MKAGFLLLTIVAIALASSWLLTRIVPTGVPESPRGEVSEAPEIPEVSETPLERAREAAQILEGGAVLDLSNQGLTRVPQDIFSRTRTTSLDLSHNELSGALPAEVRHLGELRTLDLSHNNFTGVPAEIGQLSKLEVLDLSHNPITGLPYELGSLSALRVLDLRGTQYSTADLGVISAKLSAGVEILTD